MDAVSRFRTLHEDGLLVMPNAWDIGSARLLEWRGFEAIATTSSGFAATLGRLDQQVRRDELLDHVAGIAAAVNVPVSVDSERCYAAGLDGIAETVAALADAGAAGCSIEDFDPATGSIEAVASAAERVAAAASTGRIMLTARAENHLYGNNDLDDTIARLVAYRHAGADVVYAPGLVDPDQIRRVVDSVDAPVNVLARPAGPAIPQLSQLGVRRVSTGGAMAFAAYGELLRAADELLDAGTSTYGERALSRRQAEEAFSRREGGE